MPRRKPNHDFEIHVDPSCLSATMDEETKPLPDNVEPTEDETIASSSDELQPTEEAAADQVVDAPDPSPAATEEQATESGAATEEHEQQPHQQDVEEAKEEISNSEAEDLVIEAAEEDQPIELAEEEHLEGDANDIMADHPDNSERMDHGDHPEIVELDDKSEMQSIAEQELHAGEELDEHAADSQADEDSILPSIEDDAAEDAEEHITSNRSSPGTSSRTEALIQAAARDILAQIEHHQNQQHEDESADESFISSQTGTSYDQEFDEAETSMNELQEEAIADEDGETAAGEYEEAAIDDAYEHEEQVDNLHEHEEDIIADDHEEVAIADEHDEVAVDEVAPEEEAAEGEPEAVEAVEDEHVAEAIDEGDGDSNSQHEGTDEEVFSDKSHRSSMGSYDGGSECGKPRRAEDDITVTTRSSPRVSDISQYDDDQEDCFIPTARGVPRPPFRTPSDVRALQMSSPTASVFGSVVGSSRSNKRPFPTVSRLGSPAPSAQYSPKNRTPTRFKAKEAPLVLLHVTLLPLRWMWGDVINSFEASEMSEEAKAVRDAWRMLQDRMGDTVLERGILLGHPQNDYEILEERLLEAFDLPMRRRARILECGHYLGPANETSPGEDSESEDDYDMSHMADKRHWCTTCKCDIRYDSLGPGKIFRVKVYASNGLMRAGAWAACWKEMERVDIELEPVVEAAVNEELSQLDAALREREAAQHQQIEIATEVIPSVEEQQHNTLFSDEPGPAREELDMLPVRSSPTGANRRSASVELRYQQEERLREIYGLVPGPEPDQEVTDLSARPSCADSRIPTPSTSARDHGHGDSRRQSLQSASLPELVWRAVQVLLQDRKNVVIMALGVFAILMALRHPHQPQTGPGDYELNNTMPNQHIPVVAVPKVEVVEQAQIPLTECVVDCATVPQGVASQPIVEKQQQNGVDFMKLNRPPSQDTVTQRKTVRMIQTITETETLKIETVTEIETTKVKATVTMKPAYDMDIVVDAPPPALQTNAGVLVGRNHDEV